MSVSLILSNYSRGVKNSHIYFERDYSGKGGKWRLESFHDPDYTYEHMQTTGLLPVGTHTFSWSAENCNEVSGGYGQTRQLTLSGCDEDDFTCDNGRCTRLE